MPSSTQALHRAFIHSQTHIFQKRTGGDADVRRAQVHIYARFVAKRTSSVAWQRAPMVLAPENPALQRDLPGFDMQDVGLNTPLRSDDLWIAPERRRTVKQPVEQAPRNFGIAFKSNRLMMKRLSTWSWSIIDSSGRQYLPCVLPPDLDRSSDEIFEPRVFPPSHP